MNKTKESLQELEKELENIHTGFDILQIKKDRIELDIKKKRALIMQSSILEAQHEDSLEEQDWKAEQKNIEEDKIQEDCIIQEENNVDRFSEEEYEKK